MNCYNPATFNEATNTLTPLQERVLSTLSHDDGFTVDDVARRANLGRWSPIGTRNPDIPSIQYHGPDRITARNVLGWLASKDLALSVEGRWYRSFSVRVNGQVEASLSPRA